MALDLETLGMSQEQLQDRVIDAMCSRLLDSIITDEDGDDVPVESELSRRVRVDVQKRIARIAYMVNSHLTFMLDNVIKETISNANKTLVDGIQETCKIKLKEIADTLQVTVKAK